MTEQQPERRPRPRHRGPYALSVGQAQAAAGTILANGPKRLMGWSIVSGAASTSEATAQVTSPAAGATVVTLAGLPAGDYSVSWTVELSGTLAAADTNNFQLLNGASVVLTSENLAVAGVYPQQGIVVTVPAAGSVTIQAIALGTVGAVYRGTLVLGLLAGGGIGNVLDGGQVVGVISTGQDQIDVQWMGDRGVELATSVAVLATAGKLSGCLYVEDCEHWAEAAV